MELLDYAEQFAPSVCYLAYIFLQLRRTSVVKATGPAIDPLPHLYCEDSSHDS
jgi:hypothetical protein